MIAAQFLEACQKSDLDTITNLWETHTKETLSPLEWASENGHIDIVKFLLENGAADVYIHRKDTDYNTNNPMFHASRQVHFEICILLATYGF